MDVKLINFLMFMSRDYAHVLLLQLVIECQITIVYKSGATSEYAVIHSCFELNWYTRLQPCGCKHEIVNKVKCSANNSAWSMVHEFSVLLNDIGEM